MTDVLVIGSGPAGLSAAISAKQNHLNTVIVEKDYMGTGQISGSVRVDNYPGCPGLSGFDLGERFRQHAEALGIPFETGLVSRICPWSDGWVAKFEGRDPIFAKTVIYAAGTQPRKLGVQGEEKLFGRGVSSCVVCDGMFFKNRTAAVIGGGDSALDYASFLSEICAKVYLIHRRKEFKGNQVTLDALKQNSKVEILSDTVVTRFEGKDCLEHIVLSDGRKVAVDGLFEAVGAVPRTDLLKGIVKLDADGYIVAGEDGRTSAKGFFAAGDVRTKRLRQVSTAVADGANAARSAAEYIGIV